MKILILGSNGQLGRSISDIFPSYLNKFEYSKDQLSISDNERLLETYKKIDPDVFETIIASILLSKRTSEI